MNTFQTGISSFIRTQEYYAVVMRGQLGRKQAKRRYIGCNVIQRTAFWGLVEIETVYLG
jgi:hypothetical protein